MLHRSFNKFPMVEVLKANSPKTEYVLIVGISSEAATQGFDILLLFYKAF